MIENANFLSVKAYTGTTIRQGSDLESATSITCTTIYPGGLFGEATFFVPRKDMVGTWSVQLNDRIVIRNGQRLVYEGYLVTIAPTLDQNQSGYNCTCLGAWGNFLMQRKTAKPWAITDLSDSTWRPPAAANNAYDLSLTEIFELDTSMGFIRFIPRPKAWLNNQYVRRVYTPPTGHTMKRITGKFNLQEAAQAWLVGIYNNTSTTAEKTRNSSGVETFDVTFATPSSELWYYYQAQANQTATDTDTLHGDLEYCTIYGETGDINLTEIVKDVAAMVTELSTDYGLVGTNSLSLVPFYAAPEGETYADVLTRAASFGDSSNNPWTVGIRESDLSTDGKPIIFAEQQPALTSTEYIIALDEPNVLPPFNAEQDISTVRNWISVQYQDQQGQSLFVDPNTDATLTDTASVATYGQREEWLSVNTTDATSAAEYGRRFLAQAKDAQWTISSGIKLLGSVRTPTGGSVPTSEIRAGQRIRITNWMGDISGSGLTFLITATNYSDADKTNTLSVGRPNSFEFWLALMLRQLELNTK